ncbi:MAG: DUF2255 family protein [Candidatus Limnocylindrales bacterium]
MTAWTADELDRIGRSDELQVSSQRPDGSLRPYVTIWVARLGDDLYIRSAYGPDNGWFRRAFNSGSGQIRAGGVERGVSFEEPGTAVDADLHAAYHAKYDRYGPAIVGTVVSPEAARCTLRLVPL